MKRPKNGMSRCNCIGWNSRGALPDSEGYYRCTFCNGLIGKFFVCDMCEEESVWRFGSPREQDINYCEECKNNYNLPGLFELGRLKSVYSRLTKPITESEICSCYKTGGSAEPNVNGISTHGKTGGGCGKIRRSVVFWCAYCEELSASQDIRYVKDDNQILYCDVCVATGEFTNPKSWEN